MTVMIFLASMLLAVCGATIALVMFAIRGNWKPLINRLFILMGCCLLLWAFGLAVTLAAPGAQISTIGRRLAPLGWSMALCVLLHFCLLLTGRTGWLRWWIYPLLYFPGIVAVLGFTVLPFFGINPDHLTYSNFGWVDTARINGWDWYYYAFALAFTSLCLWLLLSWNKRSADPKIKKQANLLAATIALAAVLSATTDIAPSFLGLRLPQVAAIFILLPIVAVSYCIKRYAMLCSEEIDPNEIILSKTALTFVYRDMSVAAVAISVALLLSENFFFPQTPWWLSVKMFSIFWVLSGVVHIVINRLKMDDMTKELLEAIHFSFLIPITCLWFNQLGALTMWAIVFPMMIFCLLLNHHIMLITIIGSSFITQLFNWSYMPITTQQVVGSVYLMRAIVILSTAIIAIYVHRIYTGRLWDNINHENMQTIVSEISHEFISAGTLNFDEKLHTALERCGEYIRCDRAYLILLEEDGIDIRYSQEWVAPDVPLGVKDLATSLREIRPVLLTRLREAPVYLLKDVALLPPMAGKVKKTLAEQNIRALVTLPIKKGEQIIGFLGFNANRPFRQWNLHSIPFLEIVNGIITDAVIKVDGEREIAFIAYHDQLTNLPNRILFQDRLHQAIQLSNRTNKMIGVVFMDLDSFKSINDTLGHNQGDLLLIEMARIFTTTLRSFDTVARFGGDEFILLLNQLSSTEELLDMMDHIMEAVQRPLILSGQEFFVTMSAGVSRYPHDSLDPETLIKNADTAMYSAKGLGKSRYMLCSQEMKDDILESMNLTNLLYRALERNQLLLHYQPQVDVESNSIVGLEALLRWNLPDRGLVGPVKFIPIAEQTGLIQSIGEWVLLAACRQNKRWQQMGFPNLRMAVNVSVHQIKNPRFVQIVASILERTGLSPEYLELEITESVANGNTENIVGILSRLKDLGISISIDDFGTEYSSLSRLKLLPVDRIKMDMQFVQGIEHSEKDQAISKVIINLAKSLNLKVIAEGVETASQMDFLSRKMCDEVQGYFCYRPMPAEEIEKILMNNLIIETGTQHTGLPL